MFFSGIENFLAGFGSDRLGFPSLDINKTDLEFFGNFYSVQQLQIKLNSR